MGFSMLEADRKMVNPRTFQIYYQNSCIWYCAIWSNLCNDTSFFYPLYREVETNKNKQTTTTHTQHHHFYLIESVDVFSPQIPNVKFTDAFCILK